MNAKALLIAVIIALVTAVGTAALTVTGMHLLRTDEGTGQSILSGLFSSSESHQVEFVEMKNVVITLKGTGEGEHYLLLEVNLATTDADKKKRVENMIPAIRGETVSLLSDMDYDSVRAMSVKTLRDKLMAAYSEKFASLKIRVPFDDVIISKMVFQ